MNKGKVQVKLIPNGQGQAVTVQGTFGLGSLIDRPQEGDNRMVIQMGVGMKKAIRQVLIRNIPTEEVGDWDSTLAEYVNLCILERLGVQASPIVREHDGTLTGFAREYEIVE